MITGTESCLPALCSSRRSRHRRPAPVFFSSGYVILADWWRIGLINIVIWLGLGGVWWKILGLW